MNAHDRDLLFGVLAIRVGLVTPDQLVTARNVWADDLDSPLAAILVQQGAITEAQKDAIASLVTVYRDGHGAASEGLAGLLQQPPGTWSSFGQVPTPATESDVTVVEATAQRKEETSNDEMPTLVTGKAGSAAVPEGQANRFRLLRLHDEGGLGRVYLANDHELDRTVALKEIKESLADDVASQSRFILEAEITGGLEHPGVVPVYGFGRYDDDRPYYAMRFIRGGSLRLAIEDYHANRSSADTLGLRRLLRRFIDVCNVMTYAHQRGVLHRDLKPSNVMLGHHGETLVVDWGLAKTLGDDSDIDSSKGLDTKWSITETALVPRSGSTFDDTILGKAIGSPPYMSPEQARGEHDQLGPATDIYSLGAILYAILTNRPPIEASTLAKVLSRVRLGDVPRPRSIVADVPKPLESIAMKALSLNPTDRYDKVEAMIQDVENFLADEPVMAHQESIPERVWRVSRRHRAWVRASAIAMIAITCVSVVAAVSMHRQRQLTEREKVRAEREKVRGDRVLEHIVGVFRRPDPEIDSRSITVAEALDRAIVDANERLKDEPLATASILQAIGETYDGLGLHQDSLGPLSTALELRMQHLGPTHAQTLQTESTIASAHLGMRELETAIAEFESLVRRQQAELGADHPSTIASRNGLAFAYVTSGDPEKGIVIYGENLAEDRKRSKETQTQQMASDDDTSQLTVATQTGLAFAYESLGDFEKAENQIRTAVALAKSKLGEGHPLTLSALHMQGRVLHRLERNEDAIAVLEETLAGRTERLGSSNGDTLTTQNDLAVLYFHERRFDEATQLLEEVCRLRAEKFGDEHVLTRTARWNLGKLYSQIDRPQDAAVIWQRIVDSLTDDDPTDASVAIMTSLVQAYEKAKDRTGAKDVYLQMLETTGLDKASRTRALRGVAHHSLAVREYEAANLAATQWAETADKDRVEALLCVTESELGLRDLDAAQATLDEVAKITSGDEEPYFTHLRAVLYAARGESSKADPLFRDSYRALLESDLTIKMSYRKSLARERIDAFYQEWGEPEKTAKWTAVRDGGAP